jgi:hypothetical protein
LFEFRGAVTGVDEVRVAVDESGRDQPAVAIGDLQRFEPGRRIARGTDMKNASTAAGDESALDDSQLLASWNESREAGVTPDTIAAHGGTLI